MLATRFVLATALLTLASCREPTAARPPEDAPMTGLTDSVPPPAPAPTILAELTLGSAILDGAALRGDQLYVLGRDGTAPGSMTMTLQSSPVGGAPASESFQTSDASPGAIAAIADDIVVAWNEAAGTARVVKVVRRGAVDATWTFAPPAGEVLIGPPLLTARGDSALLCVGTLDGHTRCTEIDIATGRAGAWRALPALDGLAPVVLVADWVLALCDEGSCAGHLVAAETSPDGAVHDLGKLTAPLTASLDQSLLVVGTTTSALLIQRARAQPVMLGIRPLALVADGDGAWLLDAFGYARWAPSVGTGSVVPWPAALVKSLGGAVRSIAPAGDGVAVLTGLQASGVAVIAVRLP